MWAVGRVAYVAVKRRQRSAAVNVRRSTKQPKRKVDPPTQPNQTTVRRASPVLVRREATVCVCVHVGTPPRLPRVYAPGDAWARRAPILLGPRWKESEAMCLVWMARRGGSWCVLLERGRVRE